MLPGFIGLKPLTTAEKVILNYNSIFFYKLSNI